MTESQSLTHEGRFYGVPVLTSGDPDGTGACIAISKYKLLYPLLVAACLIAALRLLVFGAESWITHVKPLATPIKIDVY